MMPREEKKILVTGGAGFIGSNFVRYALGMRPGWSIVNLDALTYAGNLANFSDLPAELARRHRFVKADICDTGAIELLFREEAFDGVFHFAAESHVDRSIVGPEAFVLTNVFGTFRLLQTSLKHWKDGGKRDAFRFLHVSTDEVYGTLGEEGAFSEDTPYDPSSPYSASKAGSDHFVKAFHRTYGLPTLVTNCSNNYGPYQFPEKLIPLAVMNILEKKPVPVYGDGRNVRDWLYVIDHCDALIRVFEQGIPGQTYNVGGGAERENIQVIGLLCELLDKRLDRCGENSSRNLITYVADRPGHDRRYSIDAGKIRGELGWTPGHRFEDALEKTVDWYLTHGKWVDSVRTGEYRKWIELNYGGRTSQT